MLDIVPSCNPVQYHGKLMMQSLENDEKPNLGPNFGPPNFFSWFLPLWVVRDCSKLSAYAIWWKTDEPNLRKWQKNPNFGPDFGAFDSNLGHKNFFLEFLLLLDVRHCHKLSSHAISRKTYDPNSRKWQKTSLWAWLSAVGAKFLNFFFVNFTSAISKTLF